MIANSTIGAEKKHSPFLRLRKFLNAFFILILMITGFITYVCYHQVGKVSKAQTWVVHTYQVLNTTNEIFLSVLETESMVRGYVISSDINFLGQLEENLLKINKNYQTIKDLVQDNPKQRELVQSLEPILMERINVFRQSVDSEKKHPTDDAKATNIILHAQELTAQIKFKIKEIYDNELALLQERKQASALNLSLTIFTITAANILNIILLFVVIFIFNYLMTKLTRSQASETQTQSLLKAIIGGTKEIIAACDLNYKIIAFNSAFESEFKKAFGKRVTLGMNIIDAISHLPEEQRKAKEVWSRALKGEEYTVIEKFGSSKTQLKEYEISFSSIFNENNELIGAAHIVRDVSERLEDENRLKDSNKTLEIAIKKLEIRGKEMLLINEMSNILSSSASLQETLEMIPGFLKRLLPFSAGALYIMNSSKNYLECMGVWNKVKGLVNTFSPEDCWSLRQGKIYMHLGSDENLPCNHYKIFEVEGEKISCLCVPMLAKNDLLGVLYIELQNEAMSDEQLHQLVDDNILLIQNVAAQIALSISNIKLYDAFKMRSTRDPLTNLYNRSYLNEVLERDIYQAKRNNFMLAFIMVDLDFFKNINDKYGHRAGDELLIKVANLFKDSMRKSDVACRYGGEEFLLILYNTTLEDTISRVESLKKAISELQFHFLNEPVFITASFGIAMYPTDGEDPEKIIRDADSALYQSKKSGRNKITVHQNIAT